MSLAKRGGSCSTRVITFSRIGASMTAIRNMAPSIAHQPRQRWKSPSSELNIGWRYAFRVVVVMVAYAFLSTASAMSGKPLWLTVYMTRCSTRNSTCRSPWMVTRRAVSCFSV